MAFKKKTYHKEENCLNCNYPLVGQYCGHCGQKAFLHKDSFGHMALHFIGDYFHYDSKFWLTIKTMFTKPGQLTKDYIEGKRVKYLNPIQLYIFVTTVFFIFGMPKSNDESSSISVQNRNEITAPPKGILGYSTESGSGQIGIGPWTPNETTKIEYDSVQNSLPENQRDGFILKHIRHKSYDHTENLGELFSRNFSKVFFLLLPFFALLLALLFRKKKLYYVDHIIFSIHFHAFVFILLLLGSLLIKIIDHSTFIFSISIATILGIGVYLFQSLKLIYPSQPFKIIIKQTILFALYFIGFIVSLIFLIIFLFLFF
jgi:hypothetical protein